LNSFKTYYLPTSRHVTKLIKSSPRVYRTRVLTRTLHNVRPYVSWTRACTILTCRNRIFGVLKQILNAQSRRFVELKKRKTDNLTLRKTFFPYYSPVVFYERVNDVSIIITYTFIIATCIVNIRIVYIYIYSIVRVQRVYVSVVYTHTCARVYTYNSRRLHANACFVMSRLRRYKSSLNIFTYYSKIS